jgi:type II secretory pathway pseudopilin PulG
VRRASGFNLGEVIASVGLLGIVILFLMGVIVVASSGASSSLESATATAMAERQLETWKQESFATLVASIGSNSSTLTHQGRDYRISTDIERLNPSPGDPDYDVLKVVTIVNWDTKTVDPSTKSRVGRVRLETQVSSVASY